MEGSGSVQIIPDPRAQIITNQDHEYCQEPNETDPSGSTVLTFLVSHKILFLFSLFQ
jgi:hypothetical protein